MLLKLCIFRKNIEYYNGILILKGKIMTDSQYDQCFIALLDILGFKNKIKEAKTSDTIHKIYNLLWFYCFRDFIMVI